jgi:hypothetical protein
MYILQNTQTGTTTLIRILLQLTEFTKYMFDPEYTKAMTSQNTEKAHFLL